MAILKDMWRVGLVEAPIQSLLTPDALEGRAIRWLPEIGRMRFVADPFGVWRDGRLHVFVETYDYRDRVGSIEVLVFDAQFNLLERKPALREPWHLSYPFIIEAEGETWMLPEAHKSGRLTLYRAEAFPDRWTAAHTITLDQVPIDATPLFHEGMWWLFYTPATTRMDKVSALHVAYAPRLAGPWTPHPLNPVRYDPASARPGGTPTVQDGVVILPVQDCSRTYGGGMRPLRITRLTPEAFEAQAGEAIRMTPRFERHAEGFHTLSAAGPVTLIDAKRREVSPTSLALDAARWLRKLSR